MSLICASKSCQSGTLILSLFLSPGPGDDIMIYAAPSTNIHTLIAINITILVSDTRRTNYVFYPPGSAEFYSVNTKPPSGKSDAYGSGF